MEPVLRKRRAAALALRAKRGLRSPESLSAAARRMYDSLTVRQLQNIASNF